MGGQLKKGDTQEEGKEKQEEGSEVGSRRHLLQMFAAINLLRSSCRVQRRRRNV